MQWTYGPGFGNWPCCNISFSCIIADMCLAVGKPTVIEQGIYVVLTINKFRLNEVVDLDRVPFPFCVCSSLHFNFSFEIGKHVLGEPTINFCNEFKEVSRSIPKCDS